MRDSGHAGLYGETARSMETSPDLGRELHRFYA